MAADTPVMTQWRRLKSEAPDTDWLFFRLGDFYELFFDDAVAAAPILGVQLTSRDQKVPMCGVPFHALEEYLGRAVAAGFRVALAEQLEEPSSTARGLVARGIVRRVGPANYMPEDGQAPGPLAAVRMAADGFGWALLWMAEGRAAAWEYHGRDFAAVLEQAWRGHRPAEAVASRELPLALPARVHPHLFAGAAARQQLADRWGVPSLARWGLDQEPLAAEALLGAIRYAEVAEGRTLVHVTEIEAGRPAGLMRADPRAMAQLGIVARTPAEPSLWTWLNLTATPMGERLLRQWLHQPLRDPVRLRARQEGVGRWLEAGPLRREARLRLGRVGDLDRRLTRIALELASPRDLVRLARGLEAVASVRDVGSPADPPGPPEATAALRVVGAALAQLDPDAPASWDAGGLLRPGADAALDRLRALAHDQRAALLALEATLQAETGIRGLKIRHHRALGYFADVPAAQVARVPSDWRRRQSLAAAERFTLPRLEDLAAAIQTATAEWMAQEEAVARAIMAAVQAEMPSLQQWARWVAELDALAALAEGADRRQLSRPVIGPAIHLVGLRHPVVADEVASYVPSDLDLDPPAKAAIITGPNMAGKSTFMRAVAQNAWLAQIGSWVAASAWAAPLFDGIHPRIGAEDDLAHGRSTFLVEMEETAQILHQAGPHSLVILDELGRGTATFDGMAIAWAVVEQLVGDDPAQAPWLLFATHYHELTQLGGPRVVNLAVDAIQREGQLVWLHEVRPGQASQSFGVAVAALAGVPRPVLRRADRLLRQWDRHGRPAPLAAEQVDWLSPDPETALWLGELDRVQLDALTPLEALQLLAEWQRRRAGGRS